MGNPLSLQQADEETIGYVTELLERNSLPASDVTEAPEQFYIASNGDDRVGVGGVEVHGSDGLVRSVVIDQSARGQGLGRELCEALEGTAADSGVETLYLLTTTAAPFFAALGYDVIDRSAPPGSIRQTSEFEDLCPSSATCLRKSLE